MSTGLDFTTLARVKALIAETTSAQDALLSSLITAVSARIEDELQRKAKKQAYTEVYTLNEASHVIALRATPVDVTQAVTVKASTTADFASSVALVANQAFVVDAFASVIRIYSQFTAPRVYGSNSPAGPIYLQVQYTGGMADTAANFILAFPDIALATDLQVRYVHQRRLTPGGNVTVGPGSTSFQDEYGLLKEVRSLIGRHRRLVWSG